MIMTLQTEISAVRRCQLHAAILKQAIDTEPNADMAMSLYRQVREAEDVARKHWNTAKEIRRYQKISLRADAKMRAMVGL
jgi:hypothetical protein